MRGGGKKGGGEGWECDCDCDCEDVIAWVWYAVLRMDVGSAAGVVDSWGWLGMGGGGVNGGVGRVDGKGGSVRF